MIHPLIARGRQAFDAGDTAQAMRLAMQMLEEAPNDADALQLLVYGQRAMGDVAAAEATLKRAIAADPVSDWALNDLTELLHGLGRKAEAETAARAALQARPGDAQAHLQLAVILGDKDDLPAAEFHNRQALALAGPHPQILVNLALNLYNQGQLDEAESALLHALRNQPSDQRSATTMAHLSRVYEAKRDMGQAWAWLERAEMAGRRTGEDFTLLRALYLGNAGREQEALELIDRAPGGRSGAARLDRARLLDRLGRYDEAWPEMVAAKAQLGEEADQTYDASAVASEFAALKAQNWANHRPAARQNDTSQPVFILGFPRSGTTLIEQVLTSHPNIAAGGELPFVHEWQRLAAAPADLGTAMRDHYLGRAGAYGLLKGRPLFTDKMPLNEVHLPLIQLAFPEAPLIRVVRHPLDVAVSMLSHNLSHGYNSGYAIETIIAHMVAMHELTRHYDEVLGHPSLTLKYEDFVAAQEAETRQLLYHVGVPFDAACLSFHANRRHAPTPSYAQVTKPLNDRSIGRWRNYAGHLKPYFDAIAPVAADLGYDIQA